MLALPSDQASSGVHPRYNTQGRPPGFLQSMSSEEDQRDASAVETGAETHRASRAENLFGLQAHPAGRGIPSEQQLQGRAAPDVQGMQKNRAEEGPGTLPARSSEAPCHREVLHLLQAHAAGRFLPPREKHQGRIRRLLQAMYPSHAGKISEDMGGAPFLVFAADPEKDLHPLQPHSSHHRFPQEPLFLGWVH